MEKNKIIHALFFAAIFIAACTNQSWQLSQAQADKSSLGPYSCNYDSDCAVKDVHNCCGYYPKCVSKDYVPDIEAVKRECRESGITSICGFPDITSCKCVENKCISIPGKDAVV